MLVSPVLALDRHALADQEERLHVRGVEVGLLLSVEVRRNVGEVVLDAASTSIITGEDVPGMEAEAMVPCD